MVALVTAQDPAKVVVWVALVLVLVVAKVLVLANANFLVVIIIVLLLVKEDAVKFAKTHLLICQNQKQHGNDNRTS